MANTAMQNLVMELEATITSTGPKDVARELPNLPPKQMEYVLASESFQDSVISGRTHPWTLLQRFLPQ